MAFYGNLSGCFVHIQNLFRISNLRQSQLDVYKRQVLQRPDVAKAGIGGSYDFRAHGIRGNREVQSAETARQDVYKRQVHYDTPSSIRVWLIMPMLYPLPALKKPKNRPVLQGESRESGTSAQQPAPHPPEQ